MRNFSICWILVVCMLTACSAAIEFRRPRQYLLLQGQVPIGRTLKQMPVFTEFGKSKIWICDDPDCPEGCNSKDPYWGNGLILEESRQIEKR